ncbi:hypothetical protein HK57_00543 [Aspergillus ustus]|uniref:Uncharacterized protein n=1 Tax=Aspergillus ustus TaxID=40382 RepID=A0A0C1E2D0_ASPUT|nr:hypothetical protein HK57_00543 [Aspergillus ustus]
MTNNRQSTPPIQHGCDKLRAAYDALQLEICSRGDDSLCTVWQKRVELGICFFEDFCDDFGVYDSGAGSLDTRASGGSAQHVQDIVEKLGKILHGVNRCHTLMAEYNHLRKELDVRALEKKSMASMGHAQTTTPFLFVHSTGPTHVHRRDETVKTEIRRHIMVDIGRARRKTPRNPTVEMVMQQPLSSGAGIRSANMNRRRYREDHRQQQQHQQVISSRIKKMKDDPRASFLTAPEHPFWDQHPLVVLERQWEMDMFSAYGIAFVVSEGRRRMGRSNNKSETKQHAVSSSSGRTLTSPEMLSAVARAPEKRFDTIALERSIGTVACIEAKLAHADSSVATAERVVRGVIASICYNSVPNAYTTIVLSCLRDLGAAAACIESRATSGKLGEDLGAVYHDDAYEEQEGEEESIGLLLNPIAHRLLSVSPTAGRCTKTTNALLSSPSNHGHRHTSITSAIRLGQILWIIAVKRRYRAYPGPSSSSTSSPALVYAKPLLSLLTDERVWAGDAVLPSVRLWLLVLCSLSLSSFPPTSSSSSFASAIDDEWTVVVDAIRDVMRRWELDSWTDVLAYVCHMPWVSTLFEPLLVGLRDEIDDHQ